MLRPRPAALRHLIEFGIFYCPSQHTEAWFAYFPSGCGAAVRSDGLSEGLRVIAAQTMTGQGCRTRNSIEDRIPVFWMPGQLSIPRRSCTLFHLVQGEAATGADGEVVKETRDSIPFAEADVAAAGVVKARTEAHESVEYKEEEAGGAGKVEDKTRSRERRALLQKLVQEHGVGGLQTKVKRRRNNDHEAGLFLGGVQTVLMLHM